MAEGDNKVLAIKNKKHGCLMKASLILLALFAVVAGGWAIYIHRKQTRLSEHVTELLAELDESRPRISDDENAAPLYREALERITDRELAKKLARTDSDEPRNWGTPEVARFLQDNAESLALIKKAVGLPRCVFRTDLSRGIVSDSEEDASRVFIALMWKIRTWHAIRTSKQAAGIDEALTLLPLAKHLSQDGSLLGRMMEDACVAWAAEMLEWLLANRDMTKADIERAMLRLAEYRKARKPFPALLAVEKALMLVTLERVISGKDPLANISHKAPTEKEHNFSNRITFFAKWTGLAFKDADNLERNYDRLILAAELADSEGLSPINEFWSRLKQEGFRGNMILRGNVWSMIMLPSTCAAARLSVAHSALPDLARLGFGCRLYRMKLGAYPEKLSDLSKSFPEHFKKLPLDPVTIRPFHYKKTTSGCRIWSPGPDLQDDGGTREDDIIFELKR